MEHSDEIEAVAKRAVDRYLNDAEFHAKVYRAVAIVDADLRQSNQGQGLESFEREVATIAASVVLVLDAEADLGRSKDT